MPVVDYSLVDDLHELWGTCSEHPSIVVPFWGTFESTLLALPRVIENSKANISCKRGFHRTDTHYLRTAEGNFVTFWQSQPFFQSNQLTDLVQ